jgi:hypothetical protein
MDRLASFKGQTEDSPARMQAREEELQLEEQRLLKRICADRRHSQLTYTATEESDKEELPSSTQGLKSLEDKIYNLHFKLA